MAEPTDISVAEVPIEPTKRFLQNGINKFTMCSKCYEEKPRGVSSASYSRLHAGFTSKGFQVWCARHQSNILHLDFQGVTVQGSGSIDPEDSAEMLERVPRVAAIIEENGYDAARAGLGVIRSRLALVGYRGEAPEGQGTTYGELLRAFSVELDNYLNTGELISEWKEALQMIKVSKGESLILPGK